MSWISNMFGSRRVSTDANKTPVGICAVALAPLFELKISDKIAMRMALIPAGTFTMGSPIAEAGRVDDEGPQHLVTISKSFYMGIHPVTVEQYRAVIQDDPAVIRKRSAPSEPTVGVSWDHAQEFCKKVSEQTGNPVRLPTEAEWEYACRAGGQTRYSFGDDEKDLGDYAWYGSNRENTGQPVGTKKPNAWGLYDMSGNVFEWCFDCYLDSYSTANNVDPQGAQSGSRHVLRGGSWAFRPDFCRSAARFKADVDYKGTYIGFRTVMEAA